MGKKIALDAPGFSLFLNGICGGPELDDSEAGVGMDVDEMAEDDPESEEKARQTVNRAQLLEIVCLLACCIAVAHTANRVK